MLWRIPALQSDTILRQSVPTTLLSGGKVGETAGESPDGTGTAPEASSDLMWGGLEVCGRLVIGLQGIAQGAKPITNRLQDAILPHIPATIDRPDPERKNERSGPACRTAS